MGTLRALALILALLGLSACGKEFLAQNKNSHSSQSHVDNFVRIDDMVFDMGHIGGSSLSAQGAYEFRTRPWPNGVVPFKFVGDLYNVARMLVFESCTEWEKRAPIKCVEHTTEPVYVEVTRESSGCWANVGKPRSGNARLNLAPGCYHNFVVAHELGHVFGLIHEHQRADRDQFIEILWDNIAKSDYGNFDIISNTSVEGPYDFHSIMHYHAGMYGISHDLLTIRPRPGFEAYANSLGLGDPSGYYGSIPTREDGLSLLRLYQTAPPPEDEVEPQLDPTRNDEFSKSNCASHRAKVLTNGIYQAMMFRNADFPGADGICQILHNEGQAGLSRVTEILQRSPEWRDRISAYSREQMVKNFYKALLGREIDESGYNTYVLGAFNYPIIVGALSTAPDFKTRFGANDSSDRLSPDGRERP